MAGDAQTAGQYIKHHLSNWTYGNIPEDYVGQSLCGDALPAVESAGWQFALCPAEAKAMGFWAVHVDTMFWSIFLGGLFLWLFSMAAKKATAGVPQGFTNFVEMLIEVIIDHVQRLIQVMGVEVIRAFDAVGADLCAFLDTDALDDPVHIIRRDEWIFTAVSDQTGGWAWREKREIIGVGRERHGDKARDFRAAH